MKRSILSLFVFSLLLPVIAHAQTETIKIFPEIKRQKITSIGGNYCQANYTNHAWDAIGEATLNEFRPSHVRVALPLRIRGQEYATFKGDKINEQSVVISLHESMKRMKEEYGVSNFTVSVWDVPDELVMNPEQNSKRRIKADKYDEVIDMIVAFLDKAKEDYGVEADYFSFNESDGGYNTLFSPVETIRFFKMAGKRFREAGLKTKFLWADTHRTQGTVEFATMIAADSTIWKDLGPLCFHSWWSENIPDSEFERVAGLAQAWNKEVWCSELGFDAMAHRQKGMTASWDYALRFARISHRIFKYAQVSVSQYWTWQNNYAIMSADTKTKYPSYYITRHYVDFLNSGTQIIHSISSDPEIISVCGINKQGELVMQILNLKPEPVEIAVQGVNDGKIRSVTTTENNLWEEDTVPGRVKKGTLNLQLKASSFNTVILH